jgi:single-stranded-DNA-specific exonuclease
MTKMAEKKWKVLHHTRITDHSTQTIVDILLKNRGIKSKKEKEEFFNPTSPEKISVKSLSLSSKVINKAIERIKKAQKKKEKIIVFGDYDADGICATAILWECLYELGLDAQPYIPERFSEGYGLKDESLQKLKTKYSKLNLIVTVDNGIVANEGVDAANKLGIDVIITDHHLKGKKLPKAYAIVHTTEIGGAGLSWILAREIKKKLVTHNAKLNNGLELAAIGTIADQLPLVGPNRSFAKYGLEKLNKTERVGLLELFKEARIMRESASWRIGTYEVNYIIAPRINAMGRIAHAIDSLKLLCTKNKNRAYELAQLLGETNQVRQRQVDDVLKHALTRVSESEKVIVLAHESYHEGVIGLIASKLVDKFYRPAIVLSKGVTYSKASARSITGFNIIEVLRSINHLWVEGGGHPMAAGFTIESEKIEIFIREINKVAQPLLSPEILQKKIKIDLKLNFDQLNLELLNKIRSFEPYGIGNPVPVFVSKKVRVKDARLVGRDRSHLKLNLDDGFMEFGAIAFGFGEFYQKLSPDRLVDVAFSLEENEWNGNVDLQLKVKDIILTH